MRRAAQRPCNVKGLLSLPVEPWGPPSIFEIPRHVVENYDARDQPKHLQYIVKKDATSREYLYFPSLMTQTTFPLVDPVL